jgi:hypothetical protein
MNTHSSHSPSSQQRASRRVPMKKTSQTTLNKFVPKHARRSWALKSRSKKFELNTQTTATAPWARHSVVRERGQMVIYGGRVVAEAPAAAAVSDSTTAWMKPLSHESDEKDKRNHSNAKVKNEAPTIA